MKPTIYDVAKKARVSIATVSKVINNTGRISEKTKNKVWKVIGSLNYQQNVIATALTGKHTYTIGLLIPDLSNLFFAELARSIEDRGNELGYNLVICSTDYNPDKEAKYIELLKRKNVDGFILASGFENTLEVEKLIAEKYPVAIVARDVPAFNVNAVCIDDFQGGYDAASCLIELGHQKIAIIARDVWSNRERIRGFRKALEDHGGIREYTFSQFTLESNVPWGKKIALDYLNSPDPPTAFFACNDLLAIGAIEAIREKKLRVPEDVSVVGFDNTVIATIIDPQLTTIAQPIQNMGREVMDLIVTEIKGEKQYKSRIVLNTKRIVRDSTARLKKERRINKQKSNA
ncbi:LacI family transcriptional regulator [Brevibacillus ruminantium]|uniref:LacI family transcriptional regulator n=1 Tax=Brevibacillus ruminantium TaxID=2950604 RepID=A0ABY4WNT8_9BACL|nr:LacI family DNA-binding transcriptional regulator [Brevibacillus ruminantium]USG67808.1 LacI family transcriptional regulator [Brevibacillus ruminantium]